jgi:hypothetical protein
MKRLWNTSLVAKIFLSYLAVVALLVLGSTFPPTLIRDFYISTLMSRMEQEAHLLGRVCPLSKGAEPDSICRQLAGELGSRITVIALDGRDLGDSAEPSVKMETIAAPREVIDAISPAPAAQRYSTTVGFDMLYRAFYQRGDKQERIVRIAIPFKRLRFKVIRGMRRSLIADWCSLAAGLLLAWWFSIFEQAHATLGRIFPASRRRSFPRIFFPP